MQYFKNLIKLGIVILGIFGSVASIIPFVIYLVGLKTPEPTSFIASVKTFVFNINYIKITVSLSVVWTIIFITGRNLTSRGNIHFSKLVRKFNPVYSLLAIKRIHTLEHLYFKLSINTPNTNDVFNDSVRNDLCEFLKECKYIIDKICGEDVAVHVKLFKHRLQTNVECLPLRKAVLRTILRIPSKREILLLNKSELTERRNEEEFGILKGKQGFPEEMFNKSDKLKSTRKKVCSAYNYVFSKSEHYFICNNLSRAEKKKKYFSTSENYNRYYNSLAVFLINSNLNEGQPVDHDPIFGILVIDCFKSGTFDKDYLKILGGYMAHRLFDAFTMIIKNTRTGGN